jgi:hypothetical protein
LSTGRGHPADIELATIEPAGATWSAGAGEFILPYEDARTLPDPDSAVLAFLRTTYEGAASRMGWASGLTEVSTPPSHTSMASSRKERQHE